MRKYKMELPDAAGYSMLGHERPTALTACTNLTFTSMKLALKRIFGGKPSASSGEGITQETEEQKQQRGKS